MGKNSLRLTGKSEVKYPQVKTAVTALQETEKGPVILNATFGLPMLDMCKKSLIFFIGSQLKFGLISPHYSGGRTTQKNTPARHTTRSPPQRQYMSLFCMHSLMEGEVVRNCTRNIEMGVPLLSRCPRWLYDSYLK